MTENNTKAASKGKFSMYITSLENPPAALETSPAPRHRACKATRFPERQLLDLACLSPAVL